MKSIFRFLDKHEELVMDNAPRLFKGDIVAFPIAEAPDDPRYYTVTGVVYSLITKEFHYYFEPKA